MTQGLSPFPLHQKRGVLTMKKEMATHSSTLALKIPWMEELGAGYYPWGRKELGTTEQLHFTSLQDNIGIYYDFSQD